jgi:hypothetical protein
MHWDLTGDRYRQYMTVRLTGILKGIRNAHEIKISYEVLTSSVLLTGTTYPGKSCFPQAHVRSRQYRYPKLFFALLRISCDETSDCFRIRAKHFPRYPGIISNVFKDTLKSFENYSGYKNDGFYGRHRYFHPRKE